MVSSPAYVAKSGYLLGLPPYFTKHSDVDIARGIAFLTIGSVVSFGGLLQFLGSQSLYLHLLLLLVNLVVGHDVLPLVFHVVLVVLHTKTLCVNVVAKSSTIASALNVVFQTESI
jgi:hypothetical protein